MGTKSWHPNKLLRRLSGGLLAAGLATGLATQAFSIGAETTGNMFAGGRNKEGVIWAERSLADRVDGLGYTKEKGVAEKILPWEGGPKLRVPEDLEEGFETLRYDRLLESYFRPEPDQKRPTGFDIQRSLMGTTGLLMLPNSYILAPGVWSAGLAYWNEDQGPRHWGELYRRQNNDQFKGFVNRGFHNNFEAGLILHYADADITYINQGTNPNSLRFRDDFVLGGINAKAAIPYYDLWVAAGFSLEFFDDDDRSFLDLRSYEHMSTAFLSISDSGPRWDATLAFKHIKYATSSRTPPVGGASIQSGFSPTSQWNQIGLGVEYGKWSGLSLILEATDRHRVDFEGISEKEVNYGVKYESERMVMKIFSLRENTTDTNNYGLSLSGRF